MAPPTLMVDCRDTRRVLAEADRVRQRWQPVQPLAFLGEHHRVGLGRVAGGVPALRAQHVDEHVEFDGAKADPDAGGCSQPDDLHDSSFRGRRVRARLLDASAVLL